MFCPRCGNPMELGEEANATFTCVAGQMELSRAMHDALVEVFVTRSRKAQAKPFHWGGRWYCPGCGIPMTTGEQHVRCDACSEFLDEFIHALVELHPSRSSEPGGTPNYNLAAKLLDEVRDAEAPFAEYLLRAKASGLSLIDAMDAFAWEYDEIGIENAILALVEHVGSVEAAQRVLNRTTRHVDVDVAGVVAVHRAWVAFHDASESGAPAADLLRMAVAPELPDDIAEMLLRMLTHARPLSALVALRGLVPRADAVLVREVRRRSTPIDTLDQILESERDALAALRALAFFWPIPSTPERDPELALLDTRAQLLVAAEMAIRGALAHTARAGAPSAWLPLLRRRGLAASAAALHMFEAAPKTSAAEVAAELSRAGFVDDDVFRALLENGASSRASLVLLREQGWNLERTVDALAARKMLLPEIRGHLLDLGVPLPLLRTVLLRIATEDVVALVIGDGSRAGRLRG